MVERNSPTKKMKNDRQKFNFPKLKNFKGHLQTLILFFLFFGSGLISGLSLSFYLKDSIPLNFQLIKLFPVPVSVQPPPPPSSPPPPPPSSPPPPPSPISSPPLQTTVTTPPPHNNNIDNNNNNQTVESMTTTTMTPSTTSKRRRIGIKKFIKPDLTVHDMTDDELLWRASMIPRVKQFPFNRTPKVAFMFLVRKTLSFAPLWQAFFKGHEGLYSIYVHTQPFFNATYPTESVFHGRRIPSKVVTWGKFNMVEAERRLLANALLDFSNQRFLLLSESCIPLFNFTTVYNYLMNSKKSFVESYDLWGPVGKGRYSRRMSPTVTVEQWKKGAQWFEMDRELAIEIISDRKFAPLFKKYCKPACYSDEHYLPTLIYLKYPWKNSNRTLTWVDWSKGGPHPTKYSRSEVTVELLNRMRFGSSCEYNGKKTNICYMFARKFFPNALDRLLRYAPTVMMIDV